MKPQLARYAAIGLLLSAVSLPTLVGKLNTQTGRAAAPAKPQAPSIVVTPYTPSFDVQDPTNLQEAAYFAWQEFIALTWPAPAQGQGTPAAFPRGVPLVNGTYGKAGPTGQVVFETFRHKVEVFPGGSGVNPNGYDPTRPDFGFSSAPNYQYDPASTGFPTSAIPPIPGQKNPPYPPFNNLDEVTQITLNAMYAGVVDPHPAMGGNTQTNQLEKILFQAKVNQTHYAYVAANKYWGQDANPNLATILTNSGSFVQTGDAKTYPGPYISLPASNPANKALGTIETKMAWRRLNKNEDASKFYTARVRYYVGTVNQGTPKIQGFVDSDQAGETWALVALHIIQKTPNAPSFIYATFGHINNIVDANGNPVEMPDGTTKPQYVNTQPFIPTLNITPAAPTPGSFQTETTTGSPTVNTNSPQLYYRNTETQEVTTYPDGKTPYTDPVTVNRRLFMIPPTITAANQAAHQAISAANKNAVWLNYRLINVQARPIDIDDLATADEPTYYLANEVVETNPSLQRFRGGLASNGKIFTYSNYISPQPPGKDFNTFVVVDPNPNKPVINKYLMGGCMGCHGSQGQKVGGDFSVILARGRVPTPEIIQEDETQEALMRLNSLKYIKPLTASGKKPVPRPKPKPRR